MGTGLLNVGISGLISSQKALGTIGHNITNSATEGYSRQRVDLATRDPQYKQGGFIGKGVEATNVRRAFDGFLTSQVRITTSNLAEIDIFNQLAIQVDDLLANPDAGLTPMLQNFFNAVHDVSDDPSSLTSRQVMIGEAQSLQSRFSAIESRLSTLEQGVTQILNSEVVEINALGNAIADLNNDIQIAKGQSVNEDPNDLLDRRDQLLVELSEHVKIETIENSDGTINVAIGSGQLLVASSNSLNLQVINNEYDVSRKEIGFNTGSSFVSVSNLLVSGKTAGLMNFRDQFLDNARNSLGRVALGLSNTFNAQHSLGIDLENNAGGDFFRDIDAVSPKVFSRNVNTGTGLFTSAVVDATALTTSDYKLDYDGTNYTLTRLSDNNQTTFLPGALPVTVDGIQLTLSSGTVNSGDGFLIQPTKAAARDFSVFIQRPQQIAVATPVRTQKSLNNGGSANISAAAITNTTGIPLALNAGDITLTYDSANSRFNVTNGPVATLAYNAVSDVNGKSFTLTGLGDISFSINGVPDDGDVFTITDNNNASGDNSNSLKLANLQLKGIFDNGTGSYADAYGQLVVDVGSLTRQSEINVDAQRILLTQATASRDNVSGVNLDEEAADLLRYQQTYQASARTIAIADTIFQSLLNAVGG